MLDGIGTRAVAFAAVVLLTAACAQQTVQTGPGTGPVPSAGAAPEASPRPDRAPDQQLPSQTPPDRLSLTPAPTQPETVVVDGRPAVALLLPLSGRVGPVGQAMLDAAQLAVFELADDTFEIQVHDTMGTPQGAAAAARAAVEGGARLILGPLFGSGAAAARPMVEASGVPMLTFSNSRAIAGNGVWVLGLLPEQQVERVIAHAGAKGQASLGLLLPATAYGDAIEVAAREAARLAGIVVTRTARYDPQAVDQSEIVKYFAEYDSRKAALDAERRRLRSVGGDIARRTLTRLQGLDTLGDPPYDTVLIPEAGAPLRNIGPLLPYYDIDPARVRILGTSAFEEDGLGREPALVGAWYAAISPAQREAFEQRFRDTFGSAPPPLATLAYDAMALAIVQSLSAPSPDFSDAALTSPSGFAGVGGIFRLLPDGSNQRGLAIMEVTPDGARLIDPAPQSFEDFGS